MYLSSTLTINQRIIPDTHKHSSRVKPHCPAIGSPGHTSLSRPASSSSFISLQGQLVLISLIGHSDHIPPGLTICCLTMPPRRAGSMRLPPTPQNLSRNADIQLDLAPEQQAQAPETVKQTPEKPRQSFSCAECRRCEAGRDIYADESLKLKCSRIWPCASCGYKRLITEYAHRR